MAETFDPDMDPKLDSSRRTALVATTAVGAVGALGVAVPLVASFQPSERAKAAGAPVEADIAGMAAGELRRVEWRGKPVWIVRRTPEMLATLKKTDDQVADPKSEKYYMLPTPDYAKNECALDQARVPGRGRHLHAPRLLADRQVRARAAAVAARDWPGGFLCPCHGSTFDLAGRVYKNKPAPDNLEVPPHTYLSDTTC